MPTRGTRRRLFDGCCAIDARKMTITTPAAAAAAAAACKCCRRDGRSNHLRRAETGHERRNQPRVSFIIHHALVVPDCHTKSRYALCYSNCRCPRQAVDHHPLFTGCDAGTFPAEATNGMQSARSSRSSGVGVGDNRGRRDDEDRHASANGSGFGGGTNQQTKQPIERDGTARVSHY